MSPLAFHRKQQTKVRLNPPTLSILVQPVSGGSIANLGSTSFTGLATVTFPTTTGVGTIGYEWRDQNGVIGIGTQLTLSNLTASDTGRQITHRAIYYPDPTRVGISTSTSLIFEPGASNSPLGSNSVSLNVRSVITFSQQPTADGGDSIEDETISISPVTPTGKATINLSDGDFSDFAKGVAYTLTPSSTLAVLATFAGGAGQDTTVATAGKGGSVSGQVILQKGFNYVLVVGSAGSDYPLGDKQSSGPGPLDISGGGYGAGGGGAGGNGGGLTGLFITSDAITGTNALLIAGGGGGAAGGTGASSRAGGDGGGLEGGDADGWSGKGTQTEPGPGFYFSYGDQYAFMNGEALEGGDGQGYEYEDQSKPWVYGNNNFSGGGGGAGYFGGGAGRSDSNGAPGSYGGAGGSGYIHPDLVTSGSFGSSDNASAGTAILSKVS